jgi:hypothetical protein
MGDHKHPRTDHKQTIRIKSNTRWWWGGRKKKKKLEGLCAEDADLVEERDVLRAVLAADVSVGHGARVLRVALLPAPAPQVGGVAAVRVVGDGAVGEEHGGGREALVVRAGDALQPRQAARRGGVELARDAAARPGQVEEEGRTPAGGGRPWWPRPRTPRRPTRTAPAAAGGSRSRASACRR